MREPSPRKPRKPEQVKADFHDAIDRIVAGKPLRKDLKAKAATGKLKLTKTNVALESGRSPALLYRDDYADIQKRIADLARPRKDRHVSPTLQAFRELQAEFDAHLEAAKKNWGELTEVFAEKLRLEEQHARDRAELDRLKRELQAARAEISELRHRIEGGNVSRLK